jgi:tetraacyldisaccharide 4'-kinase
VRAPGFWWRAPGLRSLLLAPFGALVGRSAARRMALPGARPPVPVVCIGNFVVGGAGKTPTAIAVANVVAAAGIAPVFLTRGYGGRLKGPVIVDPATMTAADVGDEALLLAAVAPTIVSRERTAAYPLLAELRPGFAIMDDGFQNPSVEKSLSLVVVDAEVGIGAGRVMPAGPLRAPLSAQFPRADAIVVLGEGPGGRDVVRRAARAGKPVLRARLEPVGLEAIGGRPAYAFSGIGRPEKLTGTLARAGVEIAGARAFADHHPFTGLEAGEILTAAEHLAAVPVTTAKDAARLAHAGPGPRAQLLARSVVLDVRVVFDDPGRLVRLVEEARASWLRRG